MLQFSEADKKASCIKLQENVMALFALFFHDLIVKCDLICPQIPNSNKFNIPKLLKYSHDPLYLH